MMIMYGSRRPKHNLVMYINKIFFYYLLKFLIDLYIKKIKTIQTYLCLFKINMNWLIFILVVIAMYLNLSTDCLSNKLK